MRLQRWRWWRRRCGIRVTSSPGKISPVIAGRRGGKRYFPESRSSNLTRSDSTRRLVWKAALYAISVGAPVSFAFTQDIGSETAIHFSSGKVFINGQEQAGTFSVYKTNLKFLYFYVPSHGLFVVSSKEFDGAIEAGTFARRQLRFEVSGIDFKLVGSRSILGNGGQPAWVRYDRNFALNVDSIMFGYGDTESAPYDWPQQIGKHI
jgi:hypothetical protein